MNVLGIGGSPRKGGNTDILLAEAMKGAGDSGAETEEIYLRDFKISPCWGCNSCDKNGLCVQNDDMQKIYYRLVQSEHIILASPIHFYSVSSHTKLMIDRCQCMWAREFKLKKQATDKENKRNGVFISVGATKGKNLFEGAKLTVKYFFDAIDVDYYSDLFIRQVDAKREIREHPEYLKMAYELGKKIQG